MTASATLQLQQMCLAMRSIFSLQQQPSICCRFEILHVRVRLARKGNQVFIGAYTSKNLPHAYTAVAASQLPPTHCKVGFGAQAAGHDLHPVGGPNPLALFKHCLWLLKQISEHPDDGPAGSFVVLAQNEPSGLSHLVACG
jgi:hypothetical protein